MTEFYDLDLTKPRNGKAELKSSAAMLNAIDKIPDCEFVELLVKQDGDQTFEFIICDISSDEIPSRNTFGIGYTERIAFLFSSKSKLPHTLAWRKSFPETMHQNQSQKGLPKDLCLYEEPESVTLITWTPERHIQRTKWWLVQASHGKLHADEQAVEPLFFNPAESIVVPNDLTSGIRQGKKLIVHAVKESTDRDPTFFKAKWKTDPQEDGANINLLDILTPEVLHGQVNTPPHTFIDLMSLTDSLNIDLVSLLRARLLAFLRNKEGKLTCDTTVLVITMPISRSTSTDPEREQVIGFVCDKTVREMLFDLEVVVEENELINQDFNGNLFDMEMQVDDFSIHPMEVLKTTNAAERREQSGYHSDIGQGVLIGAGALGGSLFDIWTRGGWGKWTIVDKDTFRPHNFTRHVADPYWVGRNKAEASANTVNYNFEGVSANAIDADACNFDNTELKSSFAAADLVIDASASLEYPREASLRKYLPRHLSAFFSPSGNDAVLLVEDKKRKIRLSSLESQYYRALIEKTVGQEHLSLSTASFRSGVSCRDLSVVMSHSRVLSLSSLLSDQIRFSSEQDNAQIMIWQDDIVTGKRDLTNVCVHKTKSNAIHTGNKFQVFWDEGLERKVKALRLAALPNETGGILVGYHDMVRKVVFVVDILPAPDDSVGTPTSFSRGTKGVVEALERVSHRTANNVGYIGEWHSHPNGSSARMSQLDKIQLTELAEKLSVDGLPAYQMIVAQKEISVFEKEM